MIVQADLIAGCLPVNCRVHNGAVYPALSPAKQSETVPAGTVYAYNCEDGFIVCTSDAAYASAGGKSFYRFTEEVSSPAFAVREIKDGSARTLVIGGGAAVEVRGGSFTVLPFGMNIKRGIMHCGRLFAVDAENADTLRWSGTGGAEDWEEGLYGAGSVRFADRRGDILNLLTFGGKIVAVRRFGLTVISAYGTPENFTVEQTDTDTDEVYADTAQVAGGRLMFFTSSGLKSFDGKTVTPAVHRCARDIFSPVCSCALGGLYFAGCSSRSLGRAVLCYDTHADESYLIDIAADCMCAYDRVHVFNADGAYTLTKGDKFRILCKGLDFGAPTKKTLSKINGAAAEIRIESGGRSHVFPCSGGTVRPHFSGVSFNLEITGAGRAEKLTAEVVL